MQKRENLAMRKYSILRYKTYLTVNLLQLDVQYQIFYHLNRAKLWLCHVNYRNHVTCFSVIYAPIKFAVASSYRLGGDAFTKNVIDRLIHGCTDGQPNLVRN